MDSKVRKPAEAEKYRLERIAEADKQKIVLEAEAEAEAKALKVMLEYWLAVTINQWKDCCL